MDFDLLGGAGGDGRVHARVARLTAASPRPQPEDERGAAERESEQRGDP
jgi:hypothetical protein